MEPVQDPELPTLADAFDREALSIGFSRIWRTAEDASVRIQVGGRTDTRYSPGSGCVATYALSSEAEGREPRASIGVVEIEPSGTTYRRYIDDPALPGLAIAADGDPMRERLTAVLDVHPLEVVDCDVHPVRYKSGTSCVLRYVLRTHEGAFSVFGKVFAGDVGRHAALLSELAQAVANERDAPRVLTPLAVLPDLGMMLQPTLAGADLTGAALGRLVPAPVRTSRMRAAGRALAAFQTAVNVPGTVRTWEEDVDELVTYRPLFAHLTPGLVGRMDDLVRRMQEETLSLPRPAIMASHGAFRTDQVVVEPDGDLAFVDLDGFCWADPARDLANALAYVEWRGIRDPGDAVLVETAMRALVDGYAARAAAPDDRRLRVYRGAALLKIAGRRLRRLAFDEWQAVPALVDRARSVISRDG